MINQLPQELRKTRGIVALIMGAIGEAVVRADLMMTGASNEGYHLIEDYKDLKIWGMSLLVNNSHMYNKRVKIAEERILNLTNKPVYFINRN